MNKLPTKPRGPRATHGIKFWLRHGKINPSIRGYKKLQKFLEDLERQLIEEQGGAANLTAARELLIRSTIRGYGVVLLSEMYVAKFSVVRPDMARRGVLQYQPIIERSYWGAMAQIRQNLLALGLDRKPEPGQDLASIIAEIDRESAEKAKAGQSKDSEEGERSDPGASGEEVSGNQGEGHE